MRKLPRVVPTLAFSALLAAMGCGGNPESSQVDEETARPGVLPSALQGARGERDSLGSQTLTSYRSSLTTCWTDASCKRVMAVAHGGAWSALGAPYDSNAALAAAYAQGIDGVKIDVRVTKDNVPVLSHSSPIMIYESLDCAGKKIEEMTAADVTKCHRLPSGTETFQRLDEVLLYLRDKMTVELTVKRSADYARTIQEVLALRAADYAYLEISTSELRDLIPKLTGSDRVYYLVNVGSNLAEVDEIIDKIKNPRAFMIEIDPGVAIGSLVSTRLHPAGLRAFIYDKNGLILPSQIKAYYNQGFDVVSTNQAKNSVTARQQVNTARGVTPP